MRNKTFTEIIQAVIHRLTLVPGTSVQLYAEDTIAGQVQLTFEMLFEKAWWPQYCSWQTAPLDGTVGVVTSTPGTLVKRFEDIQHVFHENGGVPIPILPSRKNPYALAGTKPLYIEDYTATDADKVFRVWPATATGNLRWRERHLPVEFVTDIAIDFDSEALILGACYQYAEDDGTNPGATEKFRNLFNTRVEQLLKLLLNKDMDASPQLNGVVPTDWFTARHN